MKIKILDSTSAVLSVAFTEEMVAKLQASNPKALSVFDENKNEVFKVRYEQGKNSVSQFGVTFGGVTLGETKNLTLNMVLPTEVGNDEEKAKNYIVAKLGGVIDHITAFETSIPEQYKAIVEKEKTIFDKIEVVG